MHFNLSSLTAALLIAPVAFVAPLAAAAPKSSGIYINGAFGYGFTLTDDFSRTGPLPPSNGDPDPEARTSQANIGTGSGLATSAALGYQWNNWLATEINTYYFPSTDVSDDHVVGSLALKLMIPYNATRFYGKAGAALANIQLNETVFIDDDQFDEGRYTRFTGLFALGVQQYITEQFAVNIEAVAILKADPLPASYAGLFGVSYLF